LSIETTTGMSAPPIAITRWMPTRPAMTRAQQQRPHRRVPAHRVDADELAAEIEAREIIPRLRKWRPGSSSGLLRMTPCSLPNAITEPVKVTAPTNTPTNTSISWMRASVPVSSGRGPEHRGKADQHGGRADEAVQDGDQLRHGGHLDPRREHGADAAADRQGRRHHAVTGDPRAEHGRQHRDQHAGDAVEVAAAGRFLRREATQAEDEQQAGAIYAIVTSDSGIGVIYGGTSSACAA
jgi:hypothetical protein